MAARRLATVGVALGAACALVAALVTALGSAGGGAGHRGTRAREAMPVRPSAAPDREHAAAALLPPASTTMPATAQAPQPWPAAVGLVPPVPVTLALVRTLRVGEVQELVVALGPDSGVAEVSFTVQLDGNVLQVRAAGAGGWGAGVGVHAAFDAVVADAEDRVQVRSLLPVMHAGRAGGSVAVVQVQAVGAGSTTLQLGDLVLRDAAGRQLPASPGAALLQVSVEATPPASRPAPASPSAPALTADAEPVPPGD